MLVVSLEATEWDFGLHNSKPNNPLLFGLKQIDQGETEIDFQCFELYLEISFVSYANDEKWEVKRPIWPGPGAEWQAVGWQTHQ